MVEFVIQCTLLFSKTWMVSVFLFICSSSCMDEFVVYIISCTFFLYFCFLSLHLSVPDISLLSKITWYWNSPRDRKCSGNVPCIDRALKERAHSREQSWQFDWKCTKWPLTFIKRRQNRVRHLHDASRRLTTAHDNYNLLRCFWTCPKYFRVAHDS